MSAPHSDRRERAAIRCVNCGDAFAEGEGFANLYCSEGCAIADGQSVESERGQFIAGIQRGLSLVAQSEARDELAARRRIRCAPSSDLPTEDSALTLTLIRSLFDAQGRKVAAMQQEIAKIPAMQREIDALKKQVKEHSYMQEA